MRVWLLGLTRSLCWTLNLSAGVSPKGRQVPAKGVDHAFHVLAPFPRAREGGPSASGFDPGGAGRELWREPIETAGRVTVSSERARAELFRGRPADGESPACARSDFQARLYPLAAVR